MSLNPTISAFEKSPDKGRGLARDTIVRWALEEVNQPYEVRFVNFKTMKEPDHRSVHPFGKIPTYEIGELKLFESGAIVLRIAETHPGLLPTNPKERSRVIMWMFAAVATVEPIIVELEAMMLLEKDKPYYQERNQLISDRVRVRLKELSNYMGDSKWLESDFTAGDIMMISALRRMAAQTVLKEFPNLVDYVARGEARPAFKKAFAAQLAVFEKNKDL